MKNLLKLLFHSFSDEEAPSSPTEANQDNSDPNTTTTRWMHDTMKSTMWLGTEDGW